MALAASFNLSHLQKTPDKTTATKKGQHSVNTQMACIIAYHGWGFDHTCWTSWQQHFRQRNHQFWGANRGYFGQPHTYHFSGDRPYILLLHSFGLYLCPPITIASADRVIILNSFLSFHPADPRLQRRSRLILRRMGDRFQRYPNDVLHDFWQNCDTPRQWISQSKTNINHNLLQQDLTQLGNTDLTQRSPILQALQQHPTVWVLHADADKVVSVAQGATLADAVATVPLTVIPDAGHSLPFTHPTHCWSLAPFTDL